MNNGTSVGLVCPTKIRHPWQNICVFDLAHAQLLFLSVSWFHISFERYNNIVTKWWEKRLSAEHLTCGIFGHFFAA
jgi:hypothetical protein